MDCRPYAAVQDIEKRKENSPLLSYLLSDMYTAGGNANWDNGSGKRFTPDRPNLVQLNLEGKPNGVFVKGRLSRNRMTYSYRFFGQKNQILVWDFKGPAIRAITAYPDGDTDGPGLPPEIPLNQDGAYVFSVASNTMADKIFGNFTIHLTLRAQN
jgi:hypothetical protein